MDIAATLARLDLSRKETSLYLSALKLGQFSISAIAHVSGIKRPTCYLIIDELMQKGLVSLVPRANKKLYVAESPEVLIHMMQEKERLAVALVPELVKLTKSKTEEPLVKFFRGRRGIENIYNNMLETAPGTIYSFYSLNNLFGVTGATFLQDWIEKRVAKQIAVKAVQSHTNKSKKDDFGTRPDLLREVRYLPEGMSIPGSFVVYNDKVAYISSKRDDFSFVTTNKEYARSMCGIFDVLWAVCKN